METYDRTMTIELVRYAYEGEHDISELNSHAEEVTFHAFCHHPSYSYNDSAIGILSEADILHGEQELLRVLYEMDMQDRIQRWSDGTIWVAYLSYSDLIAIAWYLGGVHIAASERDSVVLSEVLDTA